MFLFHFDVIYVLVNKSHEADLFQAALGEILPSWTYTGM